ncbi:hypothetical protein DZB84_24440 [Bacillus sp. HNG]|uniref:hypothetical protein n=1 Tax=Bacillus sp. HNG TaxID=2293325 RepID=UPI000E2EB98C|nr:hypothetical protein [Bacillus sp. HNG]RFB09318.1 hypothetical protein DZB84_24440 [Bacillus sp. HNG]
MARKNRNLASFADVANTSNEQENNNQITKENVNINLESEIKPDDASVNNVNNQLNENNDIKKDEKDISNSDIISDLMKNQKYEDKYVMKGIYVEKDLAAILDKLGKKGGRGAKSKIVNEALRKVFKESNLI